MKHVIPFMKFRGPLLIASLAVIVLGWAFTFVVHGGFSLGIDFQPGLSLTVDAGDSADIEAVRAALEGLELSFSVQPLGDVEENLYILRAASPRGEDESAAFQQEAEAAALGALENSFGSVEVLQSDYIGPSFSSNLTFQTLLMTSVALILILAYIWFRFQFAFAIGAMTALAHDVLFVLGFIGVFQLEMSAAIIAAILTVIGYSLNDTIVIFDRIRENVKLHSSDKLKLVVDHSITQSLSRTIITSVTTLVAVLAIYIFTTGSIQDFALALIVGVVVGTYSSVFVASPVFYLFKNKLKEE